MAQANNTLRAYKAIIPHLLQMDQEERIRFHQDGSYWCNKKVPELTHPTDRVCSGFSRRLVALVSGVRHALSSSRCAIVQSCNTVSFEPPSFSLDTTKPGPAPPLPQKNIAEDGMRPRPQARHLQNNACPIVEEGARLSFEQ